MGIAGGGVFFLTSSERRYMVGEMFHSQGRSRVDYDVGVRVPSEGLFPGEQSQG